MSLSKSKAIIRAIHESRDKDALTPGLATLLQTAFTSDFTLPDSNHQTPLSQAGVHDHHIALTIMCTSICKNLGPQAEPHLTTALGDTVIADSFIPSRFRCSQILLEHGARLDNLHLGIVAYPACYDHDLMIALFQKHMPGDMAARLLFYLKG